MVPYFQTFLPHTFGLEELYKVEDQGKNLMSYLHVIIIIQKLFFYT